ncbi:MAG: peptide chain release factor N(5)-glutamine methyltransferase [Acidimicrobiales bacterium]|jgi:release factor glutamine methyltransferase|nr:peptide chain release factor N(5)-glutamine methyltransferase [Acidimicrobiales bacterium]
MTGTVTWRALLAEAERALARAGRPEAALDARRIVERASGYDGAELVLGLDEPATRRGVHLFDAMVARRCEGEPLQYVLGRWGFRRLELYLDRRVLIPRPETEVVVEHTLGEIDRLARTRPVDGRTDPVLVADLGTGSGAIALSLAAERRTVEVWASDVSADALAVARANLAGLGTPAARVRLFEGSWFAALPAAARGSLDVVVSNPPYVAADEVLDTQVADWEPTGALVAGPRGDEALRVLVEQAPTWLRPAGALVVELAPWQARPMAEAASAAGFAQARIERDLVGRDRLVVARMPG